MLKLYLISTNMEDKSTEDSASLVQIEIKEKVTDEKTDESYKISALNKAIDTTTSYIDNTFKLLMKKRTFLTLSEKQMLTASLKMNLKFLKSHKKITITNYFIDDLIDMLEAKCDNLADITSVQDFIYNYFGIHQN